MLAGRAVPGPWRAGDQEAPCSPPIPSQHSQGRALSTRWNAISSERKEVRTGSNVHEPWGHCAKGNIETRRTQTVRLRSCETPRQPHAETEAAAGAAEENEWGQSFRLGSDDALVVTVAEMVKVFFLKSQLGEAEATLWPHGHTLDRTCLGR